MSSCQLALLGGSPVQPPGPDPHPTFSERCIERVTDLMRAHRTVGLNRNVDVVREAEEAIAAWQGVPEAMIVSSGHAALHSALMGLGIAFGDEVIATPYTWGASVSCILHAGAVPVFADVDRTTGLLTAASVEAAITPRTRAVVVVHLYGQPADMTGIRAVARRHGLAVVEDGSQAHGAVHAGAKVGSFGDAAGFSCMGGKLLATSEAGYLLCQAKDVYWRAALNTMHMGRSLEGEYPDELRPFVDSLVYTYRASQLDAVMLTEQLRTLDEENAGRRRNVARLRALTADLRSISFPSFGPDDDPAYHILSLNFEPEFAGISRATFLQAVRAEGFALGHYVPSLIPTWRRLHWQADGVPPIGWHAQLRAAGIDYREVDLPAAEAKCARSLEIGWNYIAEEPERMERIAEVFRKVEANLDALRAYEDKEAQPA